LRAVHRKLLLDSSEEKRCEFVVSTTKPQSEMSTHLLTGSNKLI
jgi:hypothetical protein